jgi:hypothetical protein
MHDSLARHVGGMPNDDQKICSLQHVQGWCPCDLADVITGGSAEPNPFPLWLGQGRGLTLHLH